MAKETLSSKKALEYLCIKNAEIKVAGAVIRKSDFELLEICKKNHINILTEDELKKYYQVEKPEIDYIFSFYWKKVGKDILKIPRKGSINFHPGPLPEARGSGYHVAILEEWKCWGVTAHYMDEDFDTGEIIECKRFEISEKMVNKDLVELTHKHLLILFKEIIDRICNHQVLGKERQVEGRYFSLPDLEKNKLIRQEEDIADIDRKIRAFWNPPYSGAQIEIKGKKYTLINEYILEWIAEKIKL